MKNLALVSLIAAVGCTTSSGGEKAHIGVTWDIKDVAMQPQACPPGFDTATLYTQAVDSSGNPIGVCKHTSDISGTCFIDLFTCADGAGTSAPLPPTSYVSWLQIETHDGSGIYAVGVNPKSPEGDSTFIDVTDVDLAYDTEVFTDGGHFRFTWDLQGAVTNAPLTCDQAGASPPNGGVELLATVSGGSAATSDIFTCADHEGTTTGIASGSYTISVDALDQSMASLGTAPPLSSQIIRPQSEITDLPHALIAIDGM